jgi:Ca2+-binding RTX toxin-like protein
MAIFNLTVNANIFSGVGNSVDLFKGPGGGLDNLQGMGGNDRFEIDEFQRGIINGGVGYDKITLDSFSNQFHTGLKISAVEELSINFQNLFATVAQLAGFTKITVTTVQPEFFFFLQGAGGALDFSTSYASTKKLNVEANMTTSAVTITGTARGDSILGSNFADTLTGGGGADQIFGGAGADKLNGGLGKDELTGGNAADRFIFSAKSHSVVGANADRIMDFDDVNTGDRIDLSALFATTMVYRHAAAFTAAGQVRINDVAGADVVVEVNTGGTLAPDFSIRLVNTTLASMNAGDFVL